MDWQEWAKRFLVQERARKLRMIELLSNGTIATSEMQKGARIDTTERNIAMEKEHVAELEDILTKAGVQFET